MGGSNQSAIETDKHTASAMYACLLSLHCELLTELKNTIWIDNEDIYNDV